MTGKKKKYNSRFPPARIKKIMQKDEEVGKVAAAVPVIISRALELFVQSLLLKAGEITTTRHARTLTPSHLKQVILSEQRFDFLHEVFSSVSELLAENEYEVEPITPLVAKSPSSVAAPAFSFPVEEEKKSIKKEESVFNKCGRGRGRPRKPEKEGIKRKRGRPRKTSTYADLKVKVESDEELDVVMKEISSGEECAEENCSVKLEESSKSLLTNDKKDAQSTMTVENNSTTPQSTAIVTPSNSGLLTSSNSVLGNIQITIPEIGTNLFNISTQLPGCASSTSLPGTPVINVSIPPFPIRSSVINLSVPKIPSADTTCSSTSPVILKPLTSTTTNGSPHNSISNPLVMMNGNTSITSGVPVSVITSVNSVIKRSSVENKDVDEDYDC